MAHYDNLHPAVKGSFKRIYNCITRFLIGKNGKAHIGEVEIHTGLQDFTVDFLADMIVLMNEELHVIDIEDKYLILNYEALNEIKELEKSLLPENYNTLWSEDDFLILTDLVENKKMHIDDIAKHMARTSGSISCALSIVHKAPIICGLYATEKTFKTCADNKTSPTPM